jgi:hypothetical protein
MPSLHAYRDGTAGVVRGSAARAARREATMGSCATTARDAAERTAGARPGAVGRRWRTGSTSSAPTTAAQDPWYSLPRMTVVLAAGARTPIGRFRERWPASSVDLGAHAVARRWALRRAGPTAWRGQRAGAANGQNGRRAALQGGVEDGAGIAQRRLPPAAWARSGWRRRCARGAGRRACSRRLRLDVRAPHAVRMRPRVKMGDRPLVDVMVHDGLYCSIADAAGRDVGRRERGWGSRAGADRFAARSHLRRGGARGARGGDRAVGRSRS